MEVLKIYQEEQIFIMYYVIKHFILLKTQKYDGYERGLASVFYNVFDEKLCYNSADAIKINLHQINNALEKSCIKQSLENLKDLMYILLLTTNFGHAIHQ